MKPDKHVMLQAPDKLNGLSRLLSKLRSKINDLFEPEEVEVTFKVEGNKTSYTYTKVAHKQVA